VQPPELPSASRPTGRDVCLIVILIVGVCGFALTPTLYLLCRAWRWEQAQVLVEAAFFPVFLLFGTAALLAYRRSKTRSLAGDDDPRG
jgi:hypothetical protein